MDDDKHDNSKPEPAYNSNDAANSIRQKINSIHGIEPEAKEELSDAKEEHHHHSKHQKYILELQKSGKSTEQIQKDWHDYYLSLDNKEKNEVWDEFYAANKQAAPHEITNSPHTEQSTYISPSDYVDTDEKIKKRPIKRVKPRTRKPTKPKAESSAKKPASEIKKDLLNKVQKRSKGVWYQRFGSILFGLGVGAIVLVIFLFSFFNERFIAPFITPSQNVSAQSLIIDPSGGEVSQSPLVIIPKINVEIPVIYNVPTTDENNIENLLEDGVVHYPTTAYPGQNGNGAIFGHSSNNILNPGKYKFAFVLLHQLQVGDTFTLDYNGTAYVYQIFKRAIVPPSDVSILNDVPGHTATFTLITCDPPGTSINRLYVVGDQISPSISSNSAGPDQNSAAKPATLPSNSPSLWSRIVSLF